jgi:glyceraldehyde 3-phosphate dehydrogenase
LDPLEPHPVRAEPDRVAHVRMLELGEDAVDAVHAEAEEVLDPVIGLGAAARRRAPLREPRPRPTRPARQSRSSRCSARNDLRPRGFAAIEYRGFRDAARPLGVDDCSDIESWEVDMSARVAINGFGRVGRCAFRSAFERGAEIEWAGINDVADVAMLVHLLKHDSVYGPFPAAIEAGNGFIRVDGTEILVCNETDPANLPWDVLDVDVVLEATGRFRSRSDAAKHLEAGAKKVIISAPAKEPDATVVLGVNFDIYDPELHDVISNASCTTNCLAPVAKVLHERVGIRHGLMTTVHAYTADQRLIDLPHKDLRRARAAAVNLIPTSTGATKSLGLVIPELQGKLNGFAVRAPLPTGSLVDLTIEAQRATTAEEINAAFAEHADKGELAGILAYSEEPLVSSDIVKSPYSSIYDAPLTSVVDGTLVKVIAWYDNEWGYANRLVELAQLMLAPVLAGRVSA